MSADLSTLPADGSTMLAEVDRPDDIGQDYAEWAPPAELASDVRCLWRSEIRGPAPILPDGCLDLIVATDQVFVAGPDTRAWMTTLPPGEVLHGLRFQPGRAPRLLGVPADDLRDQRVDLADLWGRQAVRDLTLANRAREHPDALLELARRRSDRGTAEDRVVETLIRRIIRHGPEAARVGPVARALGLGERQVRRRFTRAVGYGPATFLRVVRLDRARAVARARPRLGLADVAFEAGYADQAHLSRDSRDLAGMTASSLLRLP